jgi:hypothetical protein
VKSGYAAGAAGATRADAVGGSIAGRAIGILNKAVITPALPDATLKDDRSRKEYQEETPAGSRANES